MHTRILMNFETLDYIFGWFEQKNVTWLSACVRIDLNEQSFHQERYGAAQKCHNQSVELQNSPGLPPDNGSSNIGAEIILMLNLPFFSTWRVLSGHYGGCTVE